MGFISTETALGLTENTADLILYVTVGLWYIPRADTHSNHLKQRDRLIHPTNQYESPAPKKKHKSAAAPWSVFFFFPSTPRGAKGGEKVGHVSTGKWLRLSYRQTLPVGRKFSLAAVLRSMVLKVRRSWGVWGLHEHNLVCYRRCWSLLRNVEEKKNCDKFASPCLATHIFS